MINLDGIMSTAELGEITAFYTDWIYIPARYEESDRFEASWEVTRKDWVTATMQQIIKSPRRYFLKLNKN